MAKRRGNHEGSIYKTKSGVWRAQITINGKRLSKNASTQQECREWIQEILTQSESGSAYSAAQTTYREFISNWLVSMKSSLHHNTWYQYNQVVRDYIIPELGRRKLLELRPDHIQAFYNKKVKEGKSLRTVQFIHAVVRKSLNNAVDLGVLNKNPVAGTNPPKPK